MIFQPIPGDKVQQGRSSRLWTLGEIVHRPYPVGLLHDRDGAALAVPMSELYVVLPYESRLEPKECPVEVPTEEEMAA